MSKADAIRIDALGDHDRTTFDSGSVPLDHYFKTQVRQDIKRNIARCFVAVDQENTVLGYYTLAAASILLKSLPADIVKKLPRYPMVPAVRMGRLAVAKAMQGQGLGAVLLADALKRIDTIDIAAYALIVDAKDDNAARFYAHFGFKPFDGPLKLFFCMDRVRDFAR